MIPAGGNKTDNPQHEDYNTSYVLAVKYIFFLRGLGPR